MMGILPSINAQDENLNIINFEQIIDSTLNKYLVNNPYPSASVSIVLRDSIYISKGYGWQDTNKSFAVNNNTVFNVASVSKIFVSIAIMQLVEQGKVNLFDPVTNYLDGYPEYLNDIKIWHLLTHTSGLDVMSHDTQPPTRPLMPMGEYYRKNISEIVFTPGDQINYSNHGMALAGHIVEVVSNQNFSDYTRTHIFEPLGMRHSSFKQPIPDSLLGKLGKERFDQNEWVIPYPSASLVSTSDDMGKLMLTLFSGNSPILTEDSINKILSRQYSPERDMPGIGLSFFESEFDGHQFFYHTGSKDHFAIIALVPDLKLGIYMAMNADHGDSSLRQRLVKTIIKNIDPNGDITFRNNYESLQPREGLEEYLGTYRFNMIPQKSIGKLMGLFSDLEIELGEDGFLKADGNNQIKMFKKDLFRTSDGSYLFFRRDENNQIRNLFINSPLNDSVSLVKLKWWEKSTLHLIIFLLSALVILVSIFRILIVKTLHKINHMEPKYSNRENYLINYHLISLLTFIIIPTTIAYLIFTSDAKTSYRLSKILTIAQIELYISVTLAVTNLLFLREIWRLNYWSKWSRILYTTFCCVFILLLWSLNYWSVLF